MKTLFNLLNDLLINMKSDIFYDTGDDKKVFNDIINLLYYHSNGDLLPAFMLIDKLKKQDHKNEINEMYQGLEDGMHSMAMLSKHLIEDKTSRKAKEFANFYFDETDGNIAYLINIAKSYFKNGTSDGCSNNGIWWFDNFVKILKKHKDKYLKGGASYDWACNYKHIDYIKLVLEKN